LTEGDLMARKSFGETLAFLLTAFLLISGFFPKTVFALAPVADDLFPSAESAILIERNTKRVLYKKNEDAALYPASATKILTAIVAMDYLELDELYKVGEEINVIPFDSSKAGHKIGESILGINLLRGLLLPSGNESACVIAKIAGKKILGEGFSYAEYERAFVEKMNEAAKEIGCKNTNFANPHGYHDDAHYTTASDLALIAFEFLKYPTLTQTASLTFFRGNGAGDKKTEDILTVDYDWYNSNFLLTSKEFQYRYANGLKTGSTDEAGKCLVASAEKDGKELISVILNSSDPNRWKETAAAFEFGFNNYSYQTLLLDGEKVDVMGVFNPRLGKSPEADVFARSGRLLYLSHGEAANVTKEITYLETKIKKEENEVYLSAPIAAGEPVGKIAFYVFGEEAFSADISLGEDLEERTLKSDLNYFLDLAKKNAMTRRAAPFWAGFVILFALSAILISSQIKRRRERIGLDLRVPSRKKNRKGGGARF
jgi:D-alanyl-D-alanine carboxypeptidase (penicillin-binding protein 5/6)